MAQQPLHAGPLQGPLTPHSHVLRPLHPHGLYTEKDFHKERNTSPAPLAMQTPPCPHCQSRATVIMVAWPIAQWIKYICSRCPLYEVNKWDGRFFCACGCLASPIMERRGEGDCAGWLPSNREWEGREENEGKESQEEEEEKNRKKKETQKQ